MQARKPIGEILVQQGLIHREQLDRALEAQLVFGGRIGTNLVDMRYLSLADLGRCLSLQLGVPEAKVEAFRSTAEDLLHAFPAELCAKYRIFPLRLARNALHVAMTDPQDLQQIDELTFALGTRIEPYVAPELCILFFLERRMGIVREKRFSRVRGLEEEIGERSSAELPRPVPPKVQETTLEDEAPPLRQLPPAASFSLPTGLVPPSAAPAPPPRATGSAPSPDEDFDLDLVDLDESVRAASPPAPSEPSPADSSDDFEVTIQVPGASPAPASAKSAKAPGAPGSAAPPRPARVSDSFMGLDMLGDDPPRPVGAAPPIAPPAEPRGEGPSSASVAAPFAPGDSLVGLELIGDDPPRPAPTESVADAADAADPFAGLELLGDDVPPSSAAKAAPAASAPVEGIELIGDDQPALLLSVTPSAPTSATAVALTARPPASTAVSLRAVRVPAPPAVTSFGPLDETPTIGTPTPPVAMSVLPAGRDAVIEALGLAQDRETVMRLVVRGVPPEASLSVLFVERAGELQAVVADGSSLPQSEVQRLTLSLSGPSLIRRAFVERRTVRGRSTEDPQQLTISGFLRAVPPEEAFVVPVVAGGRVESLLCVQTPSGARFARGSAEGLSALAESAGAAYTRLNARG